MRECLIGNVCIVQCKRQADGTRYGNRRRKLSAQLLETIADVSFLLSLVVTYRSSLPALLSAPRLAETWSCLVPDDVSGTEHSASPCPAAWNSLQPDIRTVSTLCTFKNRLRTHLFLPMFQST